MEAPGGQGSCLGSSRMYIFGTWNAGWHDKEMTSKAADREQVNDKRPSVKLRIQAPICQSSGWDQGNQIRGETEKPWLALNEMINKKCSIHTPVKHVRPFGGETFDF